jgi:Zn-dependent protease with chaperone function
VDLDPRVWLPLDRPDLADRGWAMLFAISLALLIPTAICVLLTIFLLTLLFTWIAHGHGNFAVANTLPWIVVGGFLVWAASALVYPLGAGRYFADGVGGRRATLDEEYAYRDALEALKLGPTVRRPKFLYVLDEHDLNACVVADAIIINRALFGSEFLEAIVAHELGHMNSMDSRVSVAVNRLGGPAGATAQLRHGHTERMRQRQPVGCLPALVVLLVRMCAGGLPTEAMVPAWAGWWRLREYAADDYAARLGQAEPLARFLEEHALLYDTPIRRIWASTEMHPPVALRVERLREQRRLAR